MINDNNLVVGHTVYSCVVCDDVIEKCLIELGFDLCSDCIHEELTVAGAVLHF